MYPSLENEVNKFFEGIPEEEWYYDSILFILNRMKAGWCKYGVTLEKYRSRQASPNSNVTDIIERLNKYKKDKKINDLIDLIHYSIRELTDRIR